MKSPLKKAHWPWPKMDIKEVAQKACVKHIYMPNIGYVYIDIEDEWAAKIEGAANSKRLWINSLVSVHACLEHGVESGDNNFIQVASHLLTSYLDRYYSNNGVFLDAWRDEHAVANRLFVITAFLHYACESTSKNSCEVIKKYINLDDLLIHAEKHAEWLNDDKNYVKNNHGVMMDLALAQYSFFIKSIDIFLYEKYIKTSERRLNMMFDLSFDKDGCCTENSPTYHFVNYSLFRAVLDFFHKFDSLDNFNGWGDRLENAKNVGNLILRSDGTLPLIGDSEEKLGTFFPLADNLDKRSGVGYYPDAGLFVASSPDFHMTFRAGGQSFSHRHIDDLSLTLQVKGKDFIIDCGMYNYDIQDKMRRWFISSRAHSGIYLESMGDVRFANFSSPQDMSRFTSVKIKKDVNNFAICGVHNLSKGVDVERSLSYRNNVLLIDDSFLSDVIQNWRVQFNLHPDVKLEKIADQNGYILENNGVAIRLIISPLYQISVESSNYSPKFMCVEKTQSLVIKGQGNALRVLSVIEL